MEQVGTQRAPNAGTAVRLPVATRALVKLIHLAHRLRGLHRFDNFVVERIAGLPIIVMPSVFNPKRLRTGEFFASQLDSSHIWPNAEVLDLGTGTGVCAVFAARYARRVVAVDINAAAVRCAKANALLNHAEDRIEVHHGDLFGPVAGRRFDLVLFNPPFLTGQARDERDRAWRSNDVAERFAEGLGRHLKPSGTGLLLLSTYGDAEIFLAPLRRRGHGVSTLVERQYVGERLTLFSVAGTGAQDAS